MAKQFFVLYRQGVIFCIHESAAPSIGTLTPVHEEKAVELVFAHTLITERTELGVLLVGVVTGVYAGTQPSFMADRLLVFVNGRPCVTPKTFI